MSDPQSLISVVVPAYNAAAYLAETCHSIFGSCPNAHVIIVNDGSTDATLEVARDLSRQNARVSVLTQQNAGVSHARNAGLAHVQSKYVCFLDADDLLYEEMLPSLSTTLDRTPSAVAAYGKVGYIDERGSVIPSRPAKNKPHLAAVDQSTLVYSNFVDTPGAMLVRSDVAQEIGGFDAALVASEDWEFYNRLSHRGQIVFVDVEAVRYRIHTLSAMKTLSVEKFKAAIDKVQEQAGYNWLRTVNARNRKLAGLYLVFAGRESSNSKRLVFCLQSLAYTVGSAPYYFSPREVLRAVRKGAMSAVGTIQSFPNLKG